jgi:predicted GIY-YIG superfamily endonuclease
MEKVYCVYILANNRDTVLYTGVTADLKVRVHQHREKLLPGFTNDIMCTSSSIMRWDVTLPAQSLEKSR